MYCLCSSVFILAIPFSHRKSREMVLQNTFPTLLLLILMNIVKWEYREIKVSPV